MDFSNHVLCNLTLFFKKPPPHLKIQSTKPFPALHFILFFSNLLHLDVTIKKKRSAVTSVTLQLQHDWLKRKIAKFEKGFNI